jgi:integrase
MARQINKLSTRTVAAANEPGMLSDGNGLYLQISPSGSKSWIYRFMLRGRSRDMGLGGVDVVTLKEARALAHEARRLVKSGIDPVDARKVQQRQQVVQAATTLTFAECARQLIKSHEPGWRNPKHRQQWHNTLETYAFPIFGDLPIDSIDTGLVLQAIEPIWTTKTETASRLRGRVEAVLDWAKARGYRSGENPARWRGHLANLLPKKEKVRRVKHHAALPYEDVGAFMKALREQDGIAGRGLEFLILTAARPGEVVGATWDEIDIDKAVWTIAADRTKSGSEHRVPLSHSAVAVLQGMEQARVSEFVFPGQKDKRPLQTAAFLRLLERMGHGDLTAHGFRSTFRDWAAERTAFPREIAEAALAHAIGNKVEAAYRRSDLLDKRRRLMDAWSEFGEQESVGNIVALRGET